jgi:hypothetical protein
MRIRSACPFVLVAVLLAVLVPPALAQGDLAKVGKYDITGTWYASNNLGNYLVYTITRVGPDEYVSSADLLTATDPWGLGATKLTAIGATLRRTGVNTYDYTCLWYYGDDNSTTPMYFGVMLAAIYSGTIVQTGPDELRMTLYGKVSCNPCWPGCWGDQSLCSLEQPWDPFNDPYALCGGAPWNPLHNVSRRVPIDKPCTPP